MQSVEGVKCTELPEMFIIMREKFLEQQIINFPGSPAQVCVYWSRVIKLPICQTLSCAFCQSDIKISDSYREQSTKVKRTVIMGKTNILQD